MREPYLMWVAGIRSGVLYTLKERPIDPKWSNKHLQIALGFVATGLYLGWSENRAFQAAEGLVFKGMYPGLAWPHEALVNDMAVLHEPPEPRSNDLLHAAAAAAVCSSLISGEQHEAE